MHEIQPILNTYSNIKYFAISNVDSQDILKEFLHFIPKNITIVPKIESPLGIRNIKEITDLLGDEKIVMLDHDDLFTSMINNNESADEFKNYIQDLVMYCSSNKITLLRTVGVIFSDNETRISQYIK